LYSHLNLTDLFVQHDSEGPSQRVGMTDPVLSLKEVMISNGLSVPTGTTVSSPETGATKPLRIIDLDDQEITIERISVVEAIIYQHSEAIRIRKDLLEDLMRQVTTTQDQISDLAHEVDLLEEEHEDLVEILEDVF
jgi:hypothetical protein